MGNGGLHVAQESVSEDANTLNTKSLDQIRKRMEQSGRIQGFQFLFSTAGGMSGFASNLLQQLSDQYPKSTKFCMV